MNFNDILTDRRAFVKWVAALPTLGAFAAADLLGKAQKATGYYAKENLYTKIGVTPIINARGTWTYTSASLELPEVKAAKQEAALHFVDMWELERGVAKRLAELSGAESGMVTSASPFESSVTVPLYMSSMSGDSTNECERYLFAGSIGSSIRNVPLPFCRLPSISTFELNVTSFWKKMVPSSSI